MQLTKNLGSLAVNVTRFPPVAAVVYNEKFRSTTKSLPGFKGLYAKGWLLPHPFDRRYQTDTSGYVPPEELPTSEFTAKGTHPYGGSQPSIIRTVLKTVLNPQNFAFIDLGCGKGRPLLVASKFPFREVIGVEFSPPLAEIARANATIFWKQPGALRPVRVEVGDAGAYVFPPGDLLIFLYNPFGEEIIQRVVDQIESALAEGNRTIYVVYYNPVFGACFDRSPRLKRYLAAALPYAQEERGFGPDLEDTVVVWQGGAALNPPLPGANLPIKIVKPGMRAELAS